MGKRNKKTRFVPKIFFDKNQRTGKDAKTPLATAAKGVFDGYRLMRKMFLTSSSFSFLKWPIGPNRTASLAIRSIDSSPIW